MCRLLWCVLLILGASINVCASDTAPGATPSGTPGPPPKTVGEHDTVHSATAAKPVDDAEPENTPSVPGSDPSDIVAPSGSPDAGRCFSWVGWETMVLIGGAVLVSTLLSSTVALAVRVCQLKRQVHGGRPTRTNVDLVSGMGYPSSSQGGSKMGSREVVSSGHTGASLKMEEVQPVEEEETAGLGRQQHMVGKEDDSGNGEASRESCTFPPPPEEAVEVLVEV